MTTIVGGICPRCGRFHDLLLAVDGSIVCRNAADIDALRAEVAALREQIDGYEAIARGMVAQARRDVLVDLRAKVTAYKQELLEDMPTNLETYQRGDPEWEGEALGETCCTLHLDHVLDLIEEELHIYRSGVKRRAMAEQHYPECERHGDGSPDCCICVRLDEHGHELLDNYFTDLRTKVQAERDKHAPGRAHDRGVPYHCGRCDALELVLDLIDREAQP